ncbi:hypothetical protein ADL35_02265 [Streptomyces sp. NRRL WC-3753]|nr:hypothetical protein ADL35_02265 [Streptomyces sp. NRRL WC-3753]
MTKHAAAFASTGLAVVGAAAVLTIGTAVVTHEPPASAQSVTVVTTTQDTIGLPTRPCTDDGTVDYACYWDAATMGNGEGSSYVVDDRGHVIYLDPRLNGTAERVAFNDRQAAQGKELWGTYDGHRFCWAKVGDTSYITCFDGYKTTT